MDLNSTVARKEHQRLRWRLLYGHAEEDIRKRMLLELGTERTAAYGPVDMTANPLLSVCSQSAALYRSQPAVFAPPGGEEAAKLIEDAGYWSLMQRVQRDTIGLREMVVRIDIDKGTGELYTVPVAPYLVDVTVDPRNPYRAVSLIEERPDPDDASKTIHVHCDPTKLLYAAYDDAGVDVSERVLGGDCSGEAYPFVGSAGALLPYVAYRAALTGSFWDAFTGRELVECSLTLGVLYSFYVHCVGSASWPQRYAVDMEVKGSREGSIPTDPATVVMFRNLGETSGQISQWAASSDPEAVLRSIQSYERRCVDAALGAANVSRTTSDIRSSFSLAVSREEQRDLQRAFEPVFRRSDLELLQKVSALTGGPVDGWRIEYKAIPKDPDEHRAELDRLTTAIEAGLLSKVDAYRVLHPQMTDAEAQTALDLISRVNRQFT